MTDYLKRRERERKLEKIRGKARNGNGNGRGPAQAGAAFDAPKPEGRRHTRREGESKRAYTVEIPYSSTRSKWHPVDKTGRFRVLTRGVFPKRAEAVEWAERELLGQPYKILLMEPVWEADWRSMEGEGTLTMRPHPAERKSPETDEDHHGSVDNLVLYIQNTSELQGDVKAIRRNLITHWARDNYNRAGAERSFKRLADTGAKRYMREFPEAPGKGFGPFTPAIRKQAAFELTDWYEAEANLGNFDYLLPARYGYKVRRSI